MQDFGHYLGVFKIHKEEKIRSTCKKLHFQSKIALRSKMFFLKRKGEIVNLQG